MIIIMTNTVEMLRRLLMTSYTFRLGLLELLDATDVSILITVFGITLTTSNPMRDLNKAMMEHERQLSAHGPRHDGAR
jgi:hypothetical protein